MTKLFSRFPPLAVWGLLFIIGLPELAWAQDTPSFSLETILPSSLHDKNFLELITIVFAMIILMTVYIALGFGGSGLVTDVFMTMSEARRMGDWGHFFKTLAQAVAVLIAAVVIAVLVWTWVTTININPTVTIGGS